MTSMNMTASKRRPPTGSRAVQAVEPTPSDDTQSTLSIDRVSGFVLLRGLIT
jgi:hypothetical protein